MPFTLTHTLAVLPFARRNKALPLAALSIGAMIPDFSLFVPFGPDYNVLHSWMGLLTACLPLGLVFFLLFRTIYCRALVELMPFSMQRRLTMFKTWQLRFTLQELLCAAIAVLLGAATHLVWDAFTHQGRWGVALIPILSEVVVHAGGSDVQGYKLFQHMSSVIGLPVMLLLACRWLLRSPSDDLAKALLSARARLALVAVLLGVPGAIVVSKLWPGNGLTFQLSEVHYMMYYFVTQFGLLFFIMFNVYALGLFTLNMTSQRRSDQVTKLATQ